MRPIQFSSERLEALFQDATVATLPQLKAALGTAVDLTVFVRLRMSVHGRVEVPLWRCFPPRVESNCIAATRCGEQLETKGQSVEMTGQNGPRHKLDTAICD
jgi:hypothetical protein